MEALLILVLLVSPRLSFVAFVLLGLEDGENDSNRLEMELLTWRFDVLKDAVNTKLFDVRSPIVAAAGHPEMADIHPNCWKFSRRIKSGILHGG